MADQDFRDRLGAEAARLLSVDALTPYAWAWLLTWARQDNWQLDEGLLQELCEQWESATLKARVIDLATHRFEYRDHGYAPADLREFPHQWLRSVLTHAVEPTASLPSAEGGHGVATSRPTRNVHNLLTALILVESETTLAAAASLLHHDWRGHEELAEFFWDRMHSLDPTTQEQWQEVLQPPQRGFAEGR